MEIRAITIKEQVYHTIKQRILDGTYPFGQKLNIYTLSKEFSISNSPIREALSLLEKDNLVTVLPNAGARVIKMDPEIYAKITDAMNVLLLGAYQLCLIQGKKDLLLEKLTTNLQRFREVISHGSKNDSIRAHLKFYCSFISATENEQCKSLCQKQFDLYYLADVYNHRNITFCWPTLLAHGEALIQAVRDDEYTKVSNMIVQYAVFHLDGDTANGTGHKA